MKYWLARKRVRIHSANLNPFPALPCPETEASLPLEVALKARGLLYMTIQAPEKFGTCLPPGTPLYLATC